MFQQIKGKKLIGRGAFTKCYDNGDTVLLVSNCPVKECNALGWLSSSRLFPKIERLDFDDNYQLFKQEKFERVKSLKNTLLPNEYKLYKSLQKLATAFQSKFAKKYDRPQVLIDLVKQSDIHYKHKIALIEAVDGLQNYTSNIGFEVSPRNVAVKKGKLILLDVFFSIDQLKNVRSNK